MKKQFTKILLFPEILSFGSGAWLADQVENEGTGFGGKQNQNYKCKNLNTFLFNFLGKKYFNSLPGKLGGFKHFLLYKNKQLSCNVEKSENP